MSDFISLLDKTVAEFEEYKQRLTNVESKLIILAVISILKNLKAMHLYELETARMVREEAEDK